MIEDGQTPDKPVATGGIVPHKVQLKVDNKLNCIFRDAETNEVIAIHPDSTNLGFPVGYTITFTLGKSAENWTLDGK